MNSLYQSGISRDTLINLLPMGRSSGGRIRIPFPQPFNFQDSVLQIVNGTVKLVSHCISGIVTMSILYSLSGKDRPAAAPDAEQVEDDDTGPRTKRPRLTRTTTGFATGLEGEWQGGLALRDRLRILNTELNRDYVRGGRTKARSKSQNWPITICSTPEGKIRSKWSCFALLATSEAEFFHHLGYADTQIYSFTWNGGRVFALEPMPQSMAGGDCTAFNSPNYAAVSTVPCSFYYIPRQTDAHLNFEAFASDVPATPEGLKRLLDQLLVNGNYKYRGAVLEQNWVERFVWPVTGEYNMRSVDGSVLMGSISPTNVFPIQASFEPPGLAVAVNTASGIGSVREISFEEHNPFGFHSTYNTWNNAEAKFQPTVITTMTNSSLGVQNQHCEISSTDVFLSRLTVTPSGTGPAICALFFGSNPLNTFFPKNRLSSSNTYNQLDLQIRSLYTHPTLTVSNEVYDYTLVAEIRNINAF